ncbi:MAG TPA: 2Fe-2S iron-sulfur cluster-binding protein [Candidatus Cloacimonadota bacterium]|nr:2Fe-2S iron-sulfur cluster-binding protein [Candidatus Cloacimonadota bacterium]
MNNPLTVYIDGIEVQVPEGTTILSAATKAGRYIPTLCYHPDLKPTSNCGICVVEFENAPGTKRACSTPVSNGMRVITNSKKLRELRKSLLEMTLSNHDVNCPTCDQNNKCELQKLAYLFDVDPDRLPKVLDKKPLDLQSFSIVRDPNKCISCGRCLIVCQEVQ